MRKQRDTSFCKLLPFGHRIEYYTKRKNASELIHQQRNNKSFFQMLNKDQGI